MSNQVKHIGRHNNRKVVVMFRQVPNEDHMCLVVYGDGLPHELHDALMKTLESDIGQQAENFADALFRTLLPDGRNALEVLHREGYMKKVQTSHVIMTPNASSAIRLDELNAILTEMAQGADAVKRLSEIDKNGGYTARGVEKSKTGYNEPEILTDDILAAQQRAQATKMRSDAEGLLLEAARLEQAAAALVPETVSDAEKIEA